MQPVIVTNAARRPRATRFYDHVELSQDRFVYGAIEEVVDVIEITLQATPLLLPACADPAAFVSILDHVDGLFLPGGVSNLHPSLYSQTPDPAEQLFDPMRDTTDLFLIRQAYKKGIPFLGVCRSCQAMNVAFGGTLCQCLPTASVNHTCSNPCHGKKAEPDFLHPVTLNPDGVLATILAGIDPVEVNSMHGQAVQMPGSDIVIEATAADGVIEAISLKSAKTFFMGVQWHPEALPDHPVSQRLFDSFREAVYRHATERHKV